MASLPLVAGERLLRSLRPHPVAFLPRFAVPLLAAAWGILLLVLFNDPGFNAFARGDFGAWYLDPRPAQTTAWAAGVVLLGLAAWRLSEDWRIPAVVGGLAVAWGLLVHLLFAPDLVGAALAWGTLFAGLVAAGLVEAQRRSHQYCITSRRLVLEGGLWRHRDTTHRWDRLRGLEGSQTLPGRFLKYGTLVPRVEGAPLVDAKEAPPALCLFGIAPYQEVQEEILGLIEAAHAPAPSTPAPGAVAAPATQAPLTTLARIEELLGGAIHED